MRNEIPMEILSSVQKPARYTGMEFGSIMKKEEEVAVAMALCFPDVYDVGMSFLGFKILYHLINKVPYLAAERVFAPWVDMEEKLRAAQLPLTSLETKKALCDFEFVGFTLQYEMSYSNILNMLDMGRIPLWASERQLEDPFVVAGGPCVFNPEPLADFMDFFLVGDGEDLNVEVMELYKQWAAEGKPEGRQGFLRRVAKVQGVYVPSLYAVSYNEDGTIAAVEPQEQGVPAIVYKRIVPDLNTVDFVTRPVVPYGDTVHDRVMLEVFRGCSRGCRFCNAGIIYRPVRERKPEVLKKLARQLVDNTGYDEISLVSLSTADYSQLRPLISDLIKDMGEEKVSVSLPSLRIDAFSIELAKEVQTVRKSGLTFAPEAGSQHMRDVINKGVTEEDLMHAVSAAFANGWSSCKLYFMIGLPEETDEDVLAIAQLAKKVQWKYKEITGKGGCRVTVSVSSFVPKCYTPFQWFPQNTAEEIHRKQMLLKNALNVKNITYQYHNCATSITEAVFARGDRRLSQVLYKAWQKGARFDGWTEHFKLDYYLEALEECGLTKEFYANRWRDKDEVFPWEHVSPGVARQFLWREWEKAQQGELTPDCRRGDCTGCAICPVLDAKIIDWKDKL